MPPQAKRESEKKYVTASIASNVSTLELGGLVEHPEPPIPQQVQGRALVGVEGGKALESFAFLIVKIP